MFSKRELVGDIEEPAKALAPHHFQTKIANLGGRIPRTIYIDPDALKRMWHFVDIAPQEVGWLGTVRTLPGGDLVIEEVFLLEQKVGPVETELSAEGIAALAQELLSRPDGFEVVNRLQFWGHSHVRMMTRASSQDEEQVLHFRDNGAPYTVRGIFNKDGRAEFSLFLWEVGIRIDDMPWAVLPSEDPELREMIVAEFGKKVRGTKMPRPRTGAEAVRKA